MGGAEHAPGLSSKQREDRLDLSFIYDLGVLILGRIEADHFFVYADGEVAHGNPDTFLTNRDADGKVGGLGYHKIHLLWIILFGVGLGFGTNEFPGLGGLFFQLDIIRMIKDRKLFIILHVFRLVHGLL